MTFQDICRLALKNNVKISFEPFPYGDRMLTIKIDVQKGTYHTAECLWPNDIENDDFIKYVMEKLMYRIERYEAECKQGPPKIEDIPDTFDQYKARLLLGLSGDKHLIFKKEEKENENG